MSDKAQVVAESKKTEEYNDQALKRAWQHLIRYDRAALRLKNDHIKLRVYVLILSFFASFLAVTVGFLASSSPLIFDNVYPFVAMLIPTFFLVPVWMTHHDRQEKKKIKQNREKAQIVATTVNADTISNTEVAESSRWSVFKQSVDNVSRLFILLQIIFIVIAVVDPIRLLLSSIVIAIMQFLGLIFIYRIDITVAIAIISIPTFFFIVRVWVRYHEIRVPKDESEKKPRFSDTTIFTIFWILVVIQIVFVIVFLSEALRLIPDSFVELSRLILFALPLVSTGILAYATKFTPNQLWVDYRYVTEAIRREIYLYRFKAAHYGGEKTESDRKEQLRKRIAEIENGKIDEEEILDEENQPNKNNEIKQSTSIDAMIPVTIFEPPSGHEMKEDELLIAIAKVKHDENKKFYDNGLQSLTFKDYINYRVYPMLSWYDERSHAEYKRMRRWQVIALIIGGAGSFLAFLGQEAWIAVTTSGAVTVGALANLRLYGRTYLLYYRASTDLKERVNKWETMDKPDLNAEQSAVKINEYEDIFKQEGRLWRQQALDALAQADASIYDSFRNGVGGAYIPGNDDPMQTTPPIESEDS